MVEFNGTPILLDHQIERESDILARLNIYRPAITALEEKVVGQTRVFLDGDCRGKECNLGNFIADSLVDWYALHYEMNEYWTDAAIGFFQAGGIRTSIERVGDGFITMADVNTLLPFGNNVVMIEVTGQQLWDALEHSVWRFGQGGAAGEFMQYSGIEVTYDVSKPSGQRIVKATALCAQCLVPVLEPIDLSEFEFTNELIFHKKNLFFLIFQPKSTKLLLCHLLLKEEMVTRCLKIHWLKTWELPRVTYS